MLYGKQMNIDFIYKQKHVMEFESAWIHYLAIKEKETGQKIEDGYSPDILIPESNIIEMQKRIKHSK